MILNSTHMHEFESVSNDARMKFSTDQVKESGNFLTQVSIFLLLPPSYSDVSSILGCTIQG